MDWKDIEKGELNTRLKWVGLVHRDKRTPGRFMMRLRTPNGIVNADLMRFYASCVEPYGPELGVIDIVRNMVGSPLAGIDDQEMVDTRPHCEALNDLICLNKETGERGNPVYSNMPRKFNVAVSGSRDDFAHTHINDIGLQPAAHGETGEMGFNVVLGGYMSTKRVAESIDMNVWLPARVDAVVELATAILRIFRDEGDRKDRQKARLMWLVEDMGVEEYSKAIKAEVESYGRGVVLEEAQPHETGAFERRELP